MTKQVPTSENLEVGTRHDDVVILKEFLERFGYYTKEVKEVSRLASADPDVFDLATALALKKYQTFHGLPETGVLDASTILMMQQPRCGVLDIGPEAQPSGSRWANTNLTYAIQNTPANLTINDVRTALQAALSLWSRVTRLAFVEVPVQQPHDFDISFAAGAHGDAFPFDGAGNVLAHAFYPPPLGGALAGDTHFDNAETWTVTLPVPINTFDLVTVAAHEFGHALGLRHTNVQGALMFPTYSGPQRFLAADDLEGIQSIYGVVLRQRFMLRTHAGYNHNRDDVFNWRTINGYDLLTAGTFGGAGGGDLLFFRRTGENRLLRRRIDGSYDEAQDNLFDPDAVREYDFVAAGQFGGTGGDDLVLIKRNGENRLLRRKADGSYERKDNLFDPPPKYDLVAAGRFGGAEGDDLFFLTLTGENRVLLRRVDGSYEPKDSLFGLRTVNGYDLIAAGRFGGTGGDDLLLITSNGLNRVLLSRGDGSYEEKDNLFGPRAVNGYDFVAAGQFGGTGGDGLFLLTRG